MDSLKQRVFLWSVAEDSHSNLRGIQPAVPASEVGRGHISKNVGDLGVESPHLTARKKTGTSVLQVQATRLRT